MSFLKGLGTFILSFLLFLSLTVFGIAFLLQSTLLNPDFVVDQVDRIDVSELAHDFAEEMVTEDLPDEARFLQDAIFDVIDDQEPWLKEQLHYATYTAYDFLLGKSDTLEITICLDSVKEDLRESIWEALNEQLSTWLPDIIQHELSPYVEEHFEEYAQLIPEEYVPPGITELPEEQMQQFLDQYLQEIEQQITKQGLMPEVTGLLEVLIKPYFDDYFDEFLEMVPSEIVYDEDNIPADVMEQLLLARKYIGYFQSGYYWLIAFMVVLAAGIFLINWNIGVAARSLGIGLFVYGALELAGVIYARTFNFMQYIPDIPASFETMLTGLHKDILAPLQLFSIIVLVIGIALIVASFFFKRKASEGPDND